MLGKMVATATSYLNNKRDRKDYGNEEEYLERCIRGDVGPDGGNVLYQ